MTREKLDSFKQMLKEKQEEDDKKFDGLVSRLQPIIDSEEEDGEKLYPTLFQLLTKEIKDLNHGLTGAYQFIGDLLDDRNKIVDWLNEETKEKDYLMKILDIIENKLDEFDEFIAKNKDKLNDVDEIKSKHGEVLDLRDELLNYQKQIQENKKTTLEQKDFPAIG